MEQLTMVPYEYFGYTVKMDERESPFPNRRQTFGIGHAIREFRSSIKKGNAVLAKKEHTGGARMAKVFWPRPCASIWAVFQRS
jgi:hypothetical protein